MRLSHWFCGKRCGLLLASVLVVFCSWAGRADAQPTVSFKVASAIANPTSLTVEVVLSAKSAQAITVQVDTVPGTAMSPGDYTAISQGTVLFPPDSISQTFTVTGITAAGNGKSFSIKLSEPINATLGTSLMSVSISTSGGGGSATVSFEASSWTVSEGAGTATVTVRMDGTPTGPVSVTCSTTTGGTATAGVDYTANTQMLTWQPNEAGTAKTFTIQVIDDSDVESTETVNLLLSNQSANSTLGQSTAVLNIMDNDVPPSPVTLQFSDWYYTGKEGTTAVIQVSLSDAYPVDVKFQCIISDF